MTLADIQIAGVLGRDAECRFTPSGEAVASFSVADDLRRKSPSGEWETVSTTWWRCQVWGKAAENLADHLLKGTRVVVTGTVHERKYEKDGQERSSFDVRARTVGIVPKGERTQRAGGGSSAGQADPWAGDGGYPSDAPF